MNSTRLTVRRSLTATVAAKPRSFTQRSVLEHTEAILLLVAYVLCNHTMQAFVPVRVLVDETIRRRLIALVLNIQNFRQKLLHCVVILVVMHTHASRGTIKG